MFASTLHIITFCTSDDAGGDGVSNVDEIEAGSDPLDPDDTKKPKRFVPIMMDDMVIMVPLRD